jgi:DNA polymerase-1
MKRFYHDGEDLHTMTAAYVKANKLKALSVQEFLPNRFEWVKQVSKEDRQGAKGVNFGFLYGQQVEGFIAFAKMTYKVDFTYDEGLQARTGYFQLYEDLVPWHRKCTEDAMRKGFTETPFGRFRRDIEDANQAINTPVQSTASDMALFALHKVDTFLKTAQWPAAIVGFVHDSIICESREDYADRVRDLIKHEMEHVDLSPLGVSHLPIPLAADVKIGLTWGDAE